MEPQTLVINNWMKNNCSYYWIHFLFASICNTNYLFLCFTKNWYSNWINEICCSHQIADDHRKSYSSEFGTTFVSENQSKSLQFEKLFQFEVEFSRRNNILILKNYCNNCNYLFRTEFSGNWFIFLLFAFWSFAFMSFGYMS